MSDQNKFHVFLGELQSLENQILYLLEQLKMSEHLKEEFEKQVSALKRENEYLKLQLENMARAQEEMKPGAHSAQQLDEGERAALKEKIQDVLKKLDF